jgi:hypothetical protein
MADKSGLDRREFLRRAAVTTAAAAWAAPVIQTVSASPAFAQTNGTPQPDNCFHSISRDEGKLNGCQNTCKLRDTGSDEELGTIPVGEQVCGPPDGACNVICSEACTGPENSCPPEYCDLACWGCNGTDPVFIC